MSNFLIFFKGIFVGVANVIPGLSGGTVAVILGIYEQLIRSLSNILKCRYDMFKVSFVFLSLIMAGALVGVFSFSFLIDWLLLNFNEPLTYFFIGVLISSVPYIVKKKSVQLFKLPNIFICFIFVIVGFFLIFLKDFMTVNSDLETVSQSYLFLSSFIAAATMIIPGVSGSLVLVLFGTYSYVILAIKAIDITVLSIVSIASFFGILSTSFVIKKALDNYFQFTMSAIIGLMVGTIPGLYVGFSSILIVYNFVFFVVGLSLVWFLDYIN
jgi:putative membrane protein